ncbi:MAG: bifunctional riboflavin kinase/FAD synthetase [Rhizobiales bacterium]|nr:bifunctional riboflavin kinase/FAD synthetase [Hyphomicrobiales bacterium]
MRVLRSYREMPGELAGASLAIGNFDGVHRGHQAVIARARALAAERGRPAGALFFDPHPRRYFNPDRPHITLTPIPLRLDLLAALGLDLAVVLPFDAALAGMPAEAFVADVLAAGLGAGQIVVGADFHFGAGRRGTPALLAELAPRHRLTVSRLEPQGEGGEVFSSSRVRAALAAGDVRAAADVLGYWWCVRGQVVSGAGRGHGLGFPTANIHLAPDQTLAHGIYAVRIRVGAEYFDGAAYLGTRPTFDNGAPVLETFLFAFDRDLYGREIEIEFIAHLRSDRAFENAGALAAQMDRDCSEARRILADLRRNDPMRAYPLGRRHDRLG